MAFPASASLRNLSARDMVGWGVGEGVMLGSDAFASRFTVEGDMGFLWMDELVGVAFAEDVSLVVGAGAILSSDTSVDGGFVTVCFCIGASGLLSI